MGVRTTASEDKVALFDSETGRAFGPVFDTDLDAGDFLRWHQNKAHDGEVETFDLRALSADALDQLVGRWEEETGEAQAQADAARLRAMQEGSVPPDIDD